MQTILSEFEDAVTIGAIKTGLFNDFGRLGEFCNKTFAIFAIASIKRIKVPENEAELDQEAAKISSIEFRSAFETGCRMRIAYKDTLLQLNKCIAEKRSDSENIVPLVVRIITDPWFGGFGRLTFKETPYDGSLDVEQICQFWGDIDRHVSGVQSAVISEIQKTCQELIKSELKFLPLIYVRRMVLYELCDYFEEQLALEELSYVYGTMRQKSSVSNDLNLVNWYNKLPLRVFADLVSRCKMCSTVLLVESTPSSEDVNDYHATLSRYGYCIRSCMLHMNTLWTSNSQRRISFEDYILSSVEYWQNVNELEELDISTFRPTVFSKAGDEDITERERWLSEDAFYIDMNMMILELDFLSFYIYGRFIFGVILNSSSLDACMKSNLIALDSRQQQIDRGKIINIGPIYFIPYLTLTIRRDHILDDALNKLVLAQVWGDRQETLKSPIKIKFYGEDGIDEGGITKEFFQLLIQQVLNPDYAMFTQINNVYYFMQDSFGTLLQFELIGIILGLAVYNHVILDIHFPHFVFKKLLSANDTVANALMRTYGDAATQNNVSPPPSHVSSFITNRINASVRASSGQDAAATADINQSTTETPSTTAENPTNSQALPPNRSVEISSRLLSGLNVPQAEKFDTTDTSYLEASRLTTYQIVHKMAVFLPRYKPSLEDLEELYPDLARGLRQLLMMKDSDTVNSLYLTFSVTRERFGVHTEVPLLKEDGVTEYDKDAPVTIENRLVYVNAILNYYLVFSIQKEFSAFYKGFHRCCGGPALQHLTPYDLHLLVCGAPGDLDFNSLKSGARYVDGYTEDSIQIKWFWEVAEALSQENKKKLLFFITGSDRTPVGGLASLKLTISRAGGDLNR